jgi:hypothetical protein
MTFTNGHSLWQHPNATKNQFRPGIVPHNKGKGVPCPHGNPKDGCRECRNSLSRQLRKIQPEIEHQKDAEKRAKISSCPARLANRRAANTRHDHSPRGVLRIYRTNAKKRGLVFSLDFDFFQSNWQAPCFYCHKKLTRVGFDRVDNEKGYLKENCVPCCERCNRMKLTLTVDEFIEHCHLIAKLHPKN